MQHEATRRHRKPRERVQQRDEDGYVCPADGQHEGDAEEQRKDERDPHHPVVRVYAGRDAERHDGGRDDAVHELLARVGDRPPGHELLQLGEGDTASRERDAADDDAEEDLDDLVDGE